MTTMTAPRALILRQVDALHCKDGDATLRRALGLILSGALILGWAAMRFLDAIGA